MISPVLTLDAAMTVGEALWRFAAHGFWKRANAPEARARAEEYANRIRKLGSAPPARSAAASEEATESVGPATDSLIDAELLLRRQLDPHHWVTIRRQDGATVFWYAFKIGRVLDRLDDMERATLVVDALELQESGSKPTAQVRTLGPADSATFSGVLLNGNEPVAIAQGLRSEHVISSRGKTMRGAHTPIAGDDIGVSVELESSEPEVEIHAHPLVQSPKIVEPQEQFDVTVGLSDTPVAGVQSAGKIVLRADAGRTTLPVEIDIVADGFDAPNGFHHTLHIKADTPTDVSVRIPLVARAGDGSLRLTSIQVLYSLDGILRGAAVRNMIVTGDDGLVPPPDDRGSYWLDSEPPAPRIAFKSAVAPDIELDITKPDGNAAKGRYLGTIRNAHGVPVPDCSFPIVLGEDAPTFAKKHIDEIRQWASSPIVDNLLQSFGETIADKLGTPFWTVVRAVQEKTPGRALTLQLNSAEPYVPWELALVDPPLDPGRPSYLSAQVAMGRWIQGDPTIPAPPRSELPVHSMAVMAGMYKPQSGLRPLPEALEEAKTIASRYASMPAVPLDCNPAALKTLLDATLTHEFNSIGGVEAVHFAGHGEVDPTRPGEAALFLNNGLPLSPLFFRRSELGTKYSPFIFLNACMVGAGGELLGGYGGFPGNCLAGGFSGLVAPLWAVSDTVAKKFALDFYREALSDTADRTVSEILRDLRAEYDSTDPSPSHLAYVFYGNPFLKLSAAGTDLARPLD